MEKVILVLNAGSSSLKFSVFALPAAGSMHPVAVGQIEGLGTAPRLKVKDGAGERMVDEQWDMSEVATHAQALQRIAGLLRSRFQGSVLAGVGHRAVSYTHLDVYKRQLRDKPPWHISWQALKNPTGCPASCRSLPDHV